MNWRWSGVDSSISFSPIPFPCLNPIVRNEDNHCVIVVNIYVREIQMAIVMAYRFG